MNLGIFISLLVILVIILIFLFIFLFYYMWNNKLKAQLGITKDVLMINEQFWNHIPNDFLFCLYKRIPNIDPETLNNSQDIIKTLKLSLNDSCSLLDKLVNNINKLSFTYLKKSLNKITNSRNSIIATSILIIKNIQNNLCFLEYKNKQLIAKHIKKQLLLTHNVDNVDDLYNLFVQKEAMNFIYYSIDVYLDDEFKTYKPFLKLEIEKLLKNTNSIEVRDKINQYISFLNKGIKNDRDTFINNIDVFELNKANIQNFFLDRSIRLINMFVNSKNEFTEELQELLVKTKQNQSGIFASNYFWMNFSNIIKKI